MLKLTGGPRGPCGPGEPWKKEISTGVIQCKQHQKHGPHTVYM